MTPKELAIEVEKLIRESGYMMGDLEFSEQVGGRIAIYSFPDHRKYSVGENGAEVIDGSLISDYAVCRAL